MCTVTFIPSKDNLFITSNRDEKYTRSIALAPARYEVNGKMLYFPRDSDKGGTWISMKENGDAAVLLNGAFLPHLSKPFYKMSRGQVFLEIFSADRPSATFYKTELAQIEPFTLIIYEKRCLYELRWDGNEKYARQLPPSRPHIWSSATLYDGFAVKKREHWFHKFLSNTPRPTRLDIRRFHQFTGDGNSNTDLRMYRDGIYSTVSICNIHINTDRSSMSYHDLIKDTITELNIARLANLAC